VGTLPLSGAACASCQAVAWSLCMQAVGSSLELLGGPEKARISDESALEAS